MDSENRSLKVVAHLRPGKNRPAVALAETIAPVSGDSKIASLVEMSCIKFGFACLQGPKEVWRLFDPANGVWLDSNSRLSDCELSTEFLELRLAVDTLCVVLLDGSTTTFEMEVWKDVKSIISEICESFGIGSVSHTYGLLLRSNETNVWLAEQQTLHEQGVIDWQSEEVFLCKRFWNPSDPIPAAALEFDAQQSFQKFVDEFKSGKFDENLSEDTKNDLIATALQISGEAPGEKIMQRRSSLRKLTRRDSRRGAALERGEADSGFLYAPFTVLLSRVPSFGSERFVVTNFRPSDGTAISECHLQISPSAVTVLLDKEQHYQITTSTMTKVVANERSLILKFQDSKGEHAATIKSRNSYVIQDAIVGCMAVARASNVSPHITLTPRPSTPRRKWTIQTLLADICQRLCLLSDPITTWLREYPKQHVKTAGSAHANEKWSAVSKGCEAVLGSTSALVQRAQVASSFSQIEVDMIEKALMRWIEDVSSMATDFSASVKIPNKLSYATGWLIKESLNAFVALMELFGKMWGKSSRSFAIAKVELVHAERSISGILFAIQASISSSIFSIDQVISLSLCVSHISSVTNFMMAEAEATFNLVTDPLQSASIRQESGKCSSALKWCLRLLECMSLVRASSRSELLNIVQETVVAIGAASNCLLHEFQIVCQTFHPESVLHTDAMRIWTSLNSSTQMFSALSSREDEATDIQADTSFICRLKNLTWMALDSARRHESPKLWKHAMSACFNQLMSSMALSYATTADSAVIQDCNVLCKAYANSLTSLEQADHLSTSSAPIYLLDTVFGNQAAIGGMIPERNSQKIDQVVALLILLRSIIKQFEFHQSLGTKLTMLEQLDLLLLRVVKTQKSTVSVAKETFADVLRLTEGIVENRFPIELVLIKARDLVLKLPDSPLPPSSSLSQQSPRRQTTVENDLVNGAILEEELKHFVWRFQSNVVPIPLARLIKICLTTFPYWSSPEKLLDVIVSPYVN
jgi:hypothetical protein